MNKIVDGYGGIENRVFSLYLAENTLKTPPTLSIGKP